MKFNETGELMFGQVREDATVEVTLFKQLPDNPQRIMVVASGGCTAFALLAHSGDCQVEAVDISGAQIALVELKARMFQQLGFAVTRDACRQDARAAFEQVAPLLSESTREFMRADLNEMRHGLNNMGTVDRQIATMANLFHMSIHSRKTTEYFLSLHNPSDQHLVFDKTWNNWKWKTAMSLAFNKNTLALAGFRGAQQFVRANFPEAMRKRLESSLTGFPNATNPYIWQAFLQRYPDEDEGLPIYLQSASEQRLIANLPRLVIYCRDLLGWLTEQEPASCDFFALSNILELLPADYAAQVARELVRVARPGAIVVTRAIFPRTGHIFPAETTGGALTYDAGLRQLAETIDRSPFCNFFQIYRVKY